MQSRQLMRLRNPNVVEGAPNYIQRRVLTLKVPCSYY